MENEFQSSDQWKINHYHMGLAVFAGQLPARVACINRDFTDTMSHPSLLLTATPEDQLEEKKNTNACFQTLRNGKEMLFLFGGPCPSFHFHGSYQCARPRQRQEQEGRKPHCHGYGSLCYDPRFVGGDGVMFYFHGAKGGNFAIVSDDNLQINAHFIGTRPEGRTRDYTWVQALAVMFDTHTLVLATKRVSKWDDSFDALTVRWDGEAVNIPTEGDAEWRTNSEEREVIVERTDETNGVKVTVAGLVELNIKVRAIGEHENKVHNYQLPADDAFAHLETQFKFIQASPLVEGVLGKSYRPDYVSPVKLGVPMPMMGGEDKYVTPSLYSPLCNACRFKGQTGSASI
ncbi:hypothetical protein V6N13_058495 [Hibiscus sabdariffa]